MNGQIVKQLDAMLALKVVGDDCGTATWVFDAKHGEGSIKMLESSEGLIEQECSYCDNENCLLYLCLLSYFYLQN